MSLRYWRYVKRLSDQRNAGSLGSSFQSLPRYEEDRACNAEKYRRDKKSLSGYGGA